jgi:hypothetical protein
MRCRTLVFLTVVAVVATGAASVALAAGSVGGTYVTTIKSPAQLKGTWKLTLARNGTYAVALNGKPLAHGRYSATPSTITMRESAAPGCGGTGTYGWTRSGKTMRFVRKREAPSCQVRAMVLAHRFTQVT